MALSPENRKRLLEASRESAVALAEDIAHLREFASKPDPTPAELRRLSSILRRLLVERDLSTVAAPRIGKIKLNAPDNKDFYKTATDCLFFASGGAAAFGVEYRALLFRMGPAARSSEAPPDQMIALSMDGFMNQKVLCLRNTWVTRNSVVKYVANVTSGVHSKAPEKDDERLLSRIRGVVSLTRGGEKPPTISINMGALASDKPEFVYSPNKLDPVLLELLVAIQLLVASPDVHALEKAIAQEHSDHFGKRAPPASKSRPQ